jgi:hypothetical protein
MDLVVAHVNRPPRLSGLTAILVLVAACSGSGDSQASPTPIRSATARLAETLPVLTELRVSSFRDLDWCRNIVLDSVQFSETQSPATCNLPFDVPAHPFDNSASRAYERVKESLRSSGLVVFDVDGHLDDSGRILDMEFATDGDPLRVCLQPCGWVVFAYKPGHGESLHTFEGVHVVPVDQNWYREEHY